MARIGMQYPVWAPLTSENGNTLTYGQGMVMGRAVSANISWQKEDNELYGDDAVAETDNSITGYTLDESTTELEEDVEAAVLGLQKVGSTDEYEQTGDSTPYGGHGYIRVLKRRNQFLYKAFWYPKLQFSQNNESDNTKSRSINWGTPTLNAKGQAVYDDASGKAKFRKFQVFTTLAAAKAYLNGKANIGTTTGGGTTGGGTTGGGTTGG